ncbi:MAG: GTP-binding protein [Promethearchaeota archaeon]
MYQATYKFVIFGDAGTGKTTLTHRFLTNVFISDSKMTIGVDFQIKTLTIENKKVKLQIWDFGGEERFRFLLPTYLRGANGGIFLYDITNEASLLHIDDWLDVIKIQQAKSPQNYEHFPILVVGSKLDLEDEREVKSTDALKIVKKRGLDGFLETSSKTGKNVEEAFQMLTRLMLQNSNLI